MNESEIDVLTQAGLSRTTAELVVAAYTMATALASLRAAQQPPPAEPAPEGGEQP